jgi:hypothetical protein
LPRRQGVEQLREIAARRAGLHIRGGQHSLRVVKGCGEDVAAGPAAERINELVLGDRVDPGTQGLPWVERSTIHSLSRLSVATQPYGRNGPYSALPKASPAVYSIGVSKKKY